MAMILLCDIEDMVPENREKLIASYMADGETREQAEATVQILLGEVEVPPNRLLD